MCPPVEIGLTDLPKLGGRGGMCDSPDDSHEESNMSQQPHCSLRIARLYPSNMKGKLHGEHRAIAVAAITAIDLGLAEVPGGRLGLNGASTRHFSFLDKPLTRDSWLPFGVVRMAIPILSQRRLLLKLMRLLRLPPASATAALLFMAMLSSSKMDTVRQW